jgi:hypothetical protein
MSCCCIKGSRDTGESQDGPAQYRRVVNGHSYSCNQKFVGGVITLVVASVLMIFAAILAAGVFGGGVKGFVAGGFAIGSMFLFGMSILLFFPKDKTPPPQPLDQSPDK